MNNKKKNEGQTDFSYYGLYLLDYLRTNRFEQATDEAFIRERADRAAGTYERAMLEGYPAAGAQELAMRTLLEGLRYSKYAILREVVENEFADDVPEAERESFTRKLLPLVGNVFSIYDLADDNFALSPDYDLLYTELTGPSSFISTSMAFNRKQRLRDNIEAIRTAFILDRERRTATPEERAVLQKYCGFGGLKCILNPARELTDAVHWAKSDLELFAPTAELHRLVRGNSKDDTQYKRYVDSLKASVLTAFYTPKEITDTIADVLADYGVRPARVLEPSAGVGVFVDAVLRHSPDADVMAFEKDLLTGTILRQLHPRQKDAHRRF